MAGGDLELALPIIREGIRHKSVYPSWSAIRCAERLGRRAKALAPELFPLLKSDDREIRLAAARALATMGDVARPGVAVMAELLKTDD